MSKSKKPNSTSVYSEQSAAVLSYKRVDPERFLSLPSGKFTSPSTITPLMFSVIAMVAVYSIAFYKREQYDTVSEWLGINAYYGIPIVIFGFSFWSLSILIFKYFKIRAQRKALSLRIVPDTLGFVLSSSTVDQVIENIESSVEEPRKFMLLNRIILVLKSIRNVGRIADIDEMLMSSADADDSRIENSYTLIRGFVWAIPVLGFIGTILGLTDTIKEFDVVLDIAANSGNSDNTSLVQGMQGAIGGLDTAFFTTGLALVAALLIHLLLTFIRKSDDELLDETRDYCHQYIVSRVRV
jgi:biopolymer transport protein ExbB/TolQ